MATRRFLPAAGHDLFLPFYDPLSRLLGAGAARAEVIAEAALVPGLRVLDVGCGTGSLLVEIGHSQPGVELVGLDPDPKALARADKKLARAGVRAELQRGFSDALPFEAESFDRVLSSFMLHHVPPAEKPATLREMRRVLRPGGTLHLIDFAQAEGAHVHGLLAHLFHAHGDEASEEPVRERLLAAGFADVRQSAGRRTLLGRIERYVASRAPARTVTAL